MSQVLHCCLRRALFCRQNLVWGHRSARGPGGSETLFSQSDAGGCNRPDMHKRKQPVTPVEPLLLTIPQVGAMLGLGHSKVYDLIRQEGLPTVKFGTATRVPAEELKQWVKQRIA